MTSDHLDGPDGDGVPFPTDPPPEPDHGEAGEAAEVYPFPGGTRPPARPAGEVRPFPRVDLAALARQGVPTPELLGAHRLLYRGGLHSLSGPPDSGKSTLFYLWAVELLAGGHPVVLLDEEAGRELAVEKLLALGASADMLDGLVYVEFPARTWDAPDRRGLDALLSQVRPALVGFDSTGAFLAQAGWHENDGPDVTAFYKGVLLTIARTHRCAVVTLDHVTKEQKDGRYARGHGAKLQLVDVAFMVDPLKPFSREQSGLLKLTVTKDRRGYLARSHQVRVDVEDGQLALSISQAGAGDGLDDPELAALDLEPAARKLLAVLREAKADGPLTQKELVDRLAARFGHGLSRQTVSAALNELARRDLADGEDGEGRHAGKRWWAT